MTSLCPLPEATYVTETHVVQASRLIEKAITESQNLRDVLLGSDHSEPFNDDVELDPNSFFGAHPSLVALVRAAASDLEERTPDDLDQMEPAEKLSLFNASEVVVDEHMETAQAVLATWAVESLVILEKWPKFTRDIRRPLAGSRQRAELAKEETTPEEHRLRRQQLFQGVMKCAFRIADEGDPRLDARPDLKRAMENLEYAAQLYEDLAETHSRTKDWSQNIREQFEETQEAAAEEADHESERERVASFLQRLTELPVELEKITASRRLNTTKLKREGLRQDWLELESKYGLEREDAQHLIGFIWILRSSIARIGAEEAQALLQEDLDEEKMLYWIADRLITRVGDVDVEGLAPEPPLQRTVEMARHSWQPLSTMMRRRAEPGVHLGVSLAAVKAVLFMEDLNPPRAEDGATADLPRLTHEQARLQMVLLKAVADLYETAGIVNTALLPLPVRARLAAATKASQPEESQEEAEPEQPTDEIETAGTQLLRRHLLAKIDGGRISTLHALKEAYADAKFFTEDIFLTGKDALPYIAVVFEHEGIKYAIAENPEVGNATYVYAEKPGQPSWKTAYEANREDARILYGAAQVKHPRGQTTAEHMEEIIAALVEYGLPTKAANAARYSLRKLDKGAAREWVSSDDFEALERLMGGDSVKWLY